LGVSGVDFEQYRQAIVDEDQLGWLSIMFWVSGGAALLFSLYFLIYVGLGLAIASIPPTGDASSPPAFFGLIFAGFGLVGFSFLAALGALKILSGFWIRKHKHRVTVMVVAGISCLEIPYGTLLGVLTFVVLGRSSVAALFGSPAVPRAQRQAPAPAPETADSFEGWT
jgi:hypothetical protein